MSEMTLEKLTESATENGRLQERARVLAALRSRGDEIERAFRDGRSLEAWLALSCIVQGAPLAAPAEVAS